jgi:hypothetical protein
MRPLTDRAVLSLWDAARAQSPRDCALTILAAAAPDVDPRELGTLSLGACNAGLLDVYRHSFGPRTCGYAECPSCGERLEVELDVEQLRGLPTAGGSTGEQVLHADGYTVHYRPPDSGDLRAASAACEVDEARRILISACVLSVRRDGAAAAAEDLPPSVVAALAAALEALEPHSDLRLDLRCPTCAHVWQLVIDPVEYVWIELSARARRLLREIDALARAYGWSEAEILALGAARREAYLELVLS